MNKPLLVCFLLFVVNHIIATLKLNEFKLKIHRRKSFGIKRLINLKHITCFILALFIFGCTQDEIEPIQPTTGSVIKNTFTYVALRNDGTIFEIGDETGEIKKVGKVPETVFNVDFNTITSDGNNTYFYEQLPEVISDDVLQSGFKGQLCRLNTDTLESNCAIVDFADPIFPKFPMLIAMDWNVQQKILIGLVTDTNQFYQEHTIYVVNIDPVTFEISYTGIQFEYGFISSTCLVENTYFLSHPIETFGNKSVFNALDLSNGTVKSIKTYNIESSPFLLSYNEEMNTLFGLSLKSNTGFLNASTSIRYEIDKEQIELIDPTHRISFSQIAGKSYFNDSSNEHIALTSDVTEGLLRYDAEANILKFVPLATIDNDLSSFIAIINKKS